MSKLKGLKGTEITRNNITIVFYKTDFQNDAHSLIGQILVSQ